MGYFDLVSASVGLSKQLGMLADDFYILEKNAFNLYEQRGSKGAIGHARTLGYRTYIYEANCTVLDTAGMASYYVGSEALNSALGGLGERFDYFSASVGSVTEYIGHSQFALVLLYWLLAGLGAYATFSKNCSCDDTLLLLTSSSILLGFIVYLGGMVSVSVGLGDFCTGPDGRGPDLSMTRLAENSLEGIQLALTKHYISCRGENPVIAGMG